QQRRTFRHSDPKLARIKAIPKATLSEGKNYVVGLAASLELQFRNLLNILRLRRSPRTRRKLPQYRKAVALLKPLNNDIRKNVLPRGAWPGDDCPAKASCSTAAG